LLGPFALRTGAVPVRALPRKAQALLAYLAMQRGRAVPREQLADLLWGRSGGEQARRSLRQCLMSVRAALKMAGSGALIADGESVSLADGPPIGLDVVEFELLGRSQAVEDLERAGALYGGEFLAGLQIAAEPVADWIAMERRRLASAMSDVLFRLASSAMQAGDAERAVSAAERLTAFDPLREDAHRILMRALSVTGRRNDALKQYAECAEILRRDLGVAPEPATNEIADTIRKGQVRAVRASAPQPAGTRKLEVQSSPLPLPEKPSIAVLPFGNLSNDPDWGYFADGMADDIVLSLGRIPWLFVIASTSTASYRGHPVDARQVGADLGVRYVLRGSVRKNARRLRIVVQLTDASHGRHIWSDRFDGDLDDVFDIQDRVTAQVASFIAPAVQLAEIERASRKPTENLDAYDLYLRAVPRFRNSLSDNKEAIRLLSKAIQIDPGYSAAYGFAARCYQFQKLLHLVSPDDPQLEEGIRLGQLAADLGQNDSEALWMAGHAMSQLAGNSELGIALIDRSLEFNPNSANAWVSSCGVRSYLGDVKTAIDHFGRAFRLNPLDTMHHHARWNILGLAHLSGGELTDAEAATDKALNVASKYLPSLRLKVILCGLRGAREEAQEHVRRLLEINAQESVAWISAFWGPPTRSHPRLLEMMIEGARRAGLPEGSGSKPEELELSIPRPKCAQERRSE
jgi:TolB-like protein/Tfp pilus assembly protein PilF